MSDIKRLTPPQSRKVNSLVRRTCCNYDSGNCILLDDGDECVCPQLISYSLLCKWFRIAVLSADKELYAELYHAEDMRCCSVCAFCVQLQPGDLLPGLPEAYHPQTDRRAHEKNAGECDAIGAK